MFLKRAYPVITFFTKCLWHIFIQECFYNHSYIPKTVLKPLNTNFQQPRSQLQRIWPCFFLVTKALWRVAGCAVKREFHDAFGKKACVWLHERWRYLPPLPSYNRRHNKRGTALLHRHQPHNWPHQLNHAYNLIVPERTLFKSRKTT